MQYITRELVEKLKERFGNGIEKIEEFRGEVSITVKKDLLLEFMKFLRNSPDFGMDMLVDVTAVDYPEHTPRIQVVYQLRSLAKRHNLRMYVQLSVFQRMYISLNRP